MCFQGVSGCRPGVTHDMIGHRTGSRVPSLRYRQRFAANYGCSQAKEGMAEPGNSAESPTNRCSRQGRLGSADRDHQDPQTTGLCLGRTDHPLGTPIDPAIFPGAGPGRSSSAAPWPDCEPFHSQPDGARPPLTRQPTQRPRKLAPAQSASASCRVLSRHLARHSHCRPPSVPPKAPADRSPTSRLPKFEPGSSRL